MREYELVLVVDSELSSDKQKQLLTKIEKVITDLKGKILDQQDWGKKAFAYLLKGRSQGFYFLWLLELPPEATRELEEKFRLEEGLLRFLLVKTLSLSKGKGGSVKSGVNKNGTKVA